MLDSAEYHAGKDTVCRECWLAWAEPAAYLELRTESSGER
jgi:hypothetical protein